jgi:integrase
MSLDQSIEKIKASRPKITESSLKTYRSILNSTFKKASSDKSKAFDASLFFDSPDLVLSAIESDPLSTKKTRLASIVCLTDAFGKDIPQYRTLMMDGIESYKQQEMKQEMSARQKENWMDWSDILKYRERAKRQAMPILNAKDLDSIRAEDLQTAQDYIILSLYTMIPPRRLLDYTLAKFNRFNPERDNFYDKKKKTLTFNQYKTAGKYGTQVVSLPSDLTKLLNKWAKLSQNDYILFDTNGNAMSQSQLSQRLNRIFAPKKISVNMLRHAYLSDQLKDVPALTHLNRLATEMGHSIPTQLGYRKYKDTERSSVE